MVVMVMMRHVPLQHRLLRRGAPWRDVHVLGLSRVLVLPPVCLAFVGMAPRIRVVRMVVVGGWLVGIVVPALFPVMA